ncbi:MAG: hypothetical protein II458_06175 [Oscillospiraceae bacterium]|nr:hypothetical protein [Oscillospiraceae bacterium]
MSRRHGIRILLAALLAISLPVLVGCAVKPDRPAASDGQNPAQTPEETPDETPQPPEDTQMETGELTQEPAKEVIPPGREKTVRVAILLASPSVTQAGFPLSSIVRDPEAKAYQEKLKSEQDEMIRRIEKRLGHSIEVKQRLIKSVNVISANVRPDDIEVIRSIDGVASVTEEMLNELTGRTTIPGQPGGKATR